MPDLQKLEQQYNREIQSLRADMALLQRIGVVTKTANVQYQAEKNAMESATLGMDIESLDRWMRRVKIVRAAALGAGVGLILGPAVVPYLQVLAGTYASAVFTGGMMVGGAVVQTLTSATGELPGTSLGKEVLTIAFCATFEGRLQSIAPQTARLIAMAPGQEYDFICQIRQSAEFEASKVSETSAQRFYAKVKTLLEYWDERVTQLNDFWFRIGWAIRDGFPARVAKINQIAAQLNAGR